MGDNINQQAQQKIAEIQRELGGKQITQENMQQLEAKKRQEQEMKQEFLTRICSAEALDRLNRVGLVKPDIARMVEDKLLNMARTGQINSQVDEDQVKGMLAAAGETKAASQRVTIQRKTYFDDSDDDNDDDLL